MKKQRKWLNEEKAKTIRIIIAVVVATVISLWLMSLPDYEKATTDDYKYLYDCLETLKIQGIEALHDMEDVEVHIQNKKLTLEHKECTLVFQMTDEHTFVEIVRQDNAWLESEIFIIIGMAIFTGSMAGYGFYFIEDTFAIICKWCFTKIKSLLNRNRESS